MVVDALQVFVKQRNDLNEQPWGGRDRPFFLNLGAIHGGVWPGSVPAECVLEGQYGFPPPGSCAGAKDELREALHDVSRRPDWPLAQPPSIEFVGLETPPEVGDPDNPIVRLLAETVSRRNGASLVESVIVGHCDLRHYTRGGSRSTSAACLYGPGGGRNVHGTDESFDLAHLTLVAGNLAGVALQWCGVARVR
jgi:acetylornithine deacetylase